MRKRIHPTWHRRTALAAAGLAGAFLLTSSPPLSAAGQGFGDPIAGQSLFVDKGCVRCHAVRGAGGRIGPDLGRTEAKGSFFEIVSGMWNHSQAMGEKMEEIRMVRPYFERGELANLVAFIYFLNYFDEPGDPRVGKILFTEKHCIQCHRVGREGGETGPPLDSLPRGISPLRIAQGLWNHGPAMVRSIRRQQLAVPQFQGDEILHLFAYLRSQGRREETREFQSPGDPERGRQLFAAKGCSRCHEVFSQRRGIGPDLGRAELHGSVTQIAGRMWNHWPAMIEAMEALDMRLPVFEGDELADLLAYLFLARYDGTSGSGREDEIEGEKVYRQKGCTVCHGPGGAGAVGPPLREKTSGESKEAIAQLMWNHAPAMQQEMGRNQIAWPRIDPGEMAHLLTFLAHGWERDGADQGPGR